MSLCLSMPLSILFAHTSSYVDIYVGVVLDFRFLPLCPPLISQKITERRDVWLAAHQ